jgi:hypothetical protein
VCYCIVEFASFLYRWQDNPDSAWCKQQRALAASRTFEDFAVSLPRLPLRGGCVGIGVVFEQKTTNTIPHVQVSVSHFVRGLFV